MLIIKRLGCISLFIFLSACATYQHKLDGPRTAIRMGQIKAAIAELQALAEQPSGDQLVYLLELGTALHIDGQFQESNKVFLQADKLADQVDYVSVSRTAIATLGSEEMLQYKGESYEKLLINAYLALNFLMMGQYDSAMVEVRRVNQKIATFRANGREDYEYNPLSHYLSALIYEGDRKYDDAYIEYKKTYELEPDAPMIASDLIRSATLAQRPDEVKKWKQQFPWVKDDAAWKDRKSGELVFVLQQGWGPKKVISRADRRFPELRPEFSDTQRALVEVKGQGQKLTEDIYNLEQSAIKTLNADYKWMVARKVGAFVAKEVVADQIRQKDELLGLIAQIAMHASDRADLRQWSTLPRSFQIVRFKLPGGEYELSAQGQTGAQAPTADQLQPVKVTIKPGRTTFFTWRTLR